MKCLSFIPLYPVCCFHKCMAYYLSCSWFDGALVDDGTEGEPGAEVSFGAVAMEKQSLWNGFVNF